MISAGRQCVPPVVRGTCSDIRVIVPSIALNRVLLKNISIVGVLWGGYVLSHPQYEKEAHAALMKMYDAGKIRPSVNAVYPFAEARRGLRDLADRKVMGKAVLTFPSQ